MSQGYALSIYDSGEYITTIVGKRIIKDIPFYVCQHADTGNRSDWTAEALSVFYSEQIATWENVWGKRWAADHKENEADMMAVAKDREDEDDDDIIQVKGTKGKEKSSMEDDISEEKEEGEEEDEEEDEEEEAYSTQAHSDSDDDLGQASGVGSINFRTLETPHGKRKSQITIGSSNSKKRRISTQTDYHELDENDFREFGFGMLAREASQALIDLSRAEPTPPPPNLHESMPMPIPHTNTSISDSIMRELLSAHDSCLYDVVNHATYIDGLPLDSWEKLNTPDADEDQRLVIIDFAVFMLAGMEEHVLRHLIAGDIPKAVHTDLELRVSMMGLRQMEFDARKPSIYINYLVDCRGDSPTPNELLRILEKMKLYLDKDSPRSCHYAARIDTCIGKHRPQTLRKLEAAAARHERRYLRDGTQSDKAREFIATLSLRLASSTELDLPLSRPLCEVGYATSPLSRIEQHKNHTSSNYLMNLVEAICKIDFPKYRIESYVLFHCFDPIHAHVGEILFTRISQAYITHGGGFNHHPAGISNYRAWDTDIRLYRAIHNEVTSSAGYIARVAKEAQIMDKIIDGWDMIEEKAKKLKEAQASLELRTEECERAEAQRIKNEHDGNLEILELLQIYEKLLKIVNDPENDEVPQA